MRIPRRSIGSVSVYLPSSFLMKPESLRFLSKFERVLSVIFPSLASIPVFSSVQVAEPSVAVIFRASLYLGSPAP